MHLNNLNIVRSLILIVTTILLHSSLRSASIVEIQNSLLQGDFDAASISINQRLINDPNDSEARVYKLLSDFGQFFETDIPNFLVANLNAKQTPTQQLFDYVGEKIILQHQDIENLSTIPEAPNFQSFSEGLQIQYYLEGDAHQVSAIIDNDMTILSMSKYFTYGDPMVTNVRIEGLTPGKTYRFQGKAQIVSYDNSDDGGFIKVGFSDDSNSQIIIRNSDLTDFSTEISMPENETKNWVEFGIAAGGNSATGTLTAIFKDLEIRQLPHTKTSDNMLEIPIEDSEGQIVNYWLTPIDLSNTNPTGSQTASYFNYDSKSKSERPFEQGPIIDYEELINRLYSRISNDGYVDFDNDGAWDIISFNDTNGNGQWDTAEPLEDLNNNGQWDAAETFIDSNGNGQWDAAEPLGDRNNNGQWDTAEPLEDKNNNGQFDEEFGYFDVNYNYYYDYGIDELSEWPDSYTEFSFNYEYEYFVDNDGNGQWDSAETFTDSNGNGQWDSAETFTDGNGNGQWDSAETFTDSNGNGQWDSAEFIQYKNVIDNPNLMAQLWDSVQAELISESESTDPNIYLINNSYGDDAVLTLEYLADSPQLNYFTIQYPNNSSHYIYIYINGAYVGYINNESFYSDNLKENGYLNLEDLNNSDSAGNLNNNTLPVYMRPGDKISFAHDHSHANNPLPYKPDYDYRISNQISNLYYNQYSQNRFTAAIQINNPSDYLVSNGSFVEGFYDFGADLSADSILDFFKEPNQPLRALLESLIDNLSSFENGDTVTLDTDFTGYTQEIVIEYPDALMLKSLAQYVYLSLQSLNKYNWDIPVPDDTLIDDYILEESFWELEDFLEDPDFSTSIFNKNKDFLELIPGNSFEHDGYKASFLTALEGFKEASQLIWERGESGSASAVYLIEISDSFKASENQSYDRLLLAIDNLITATDGFASIDDLVGEEAATSNFKYSLAPFFQTEPYDLKKAILELTDLSEDEDDGSTLNYSIDKGFISEVFPNDFYGNMLVFYEGDTVVAVQEYNETMDFEPLSGDLDSSWEDKIFEDAYSGIHLKRMDDYSATWSYNTYDSNLDSDVKRTGTVYIYQNTLDLDNDGTMDALQDIDNLDFENLLSSEQIGNAMNARYSPVSSLKGYIQLYEDYDNNSNYHYYDPEVEIKGYYYISNNDAIWEDEDEHYEYRYKEGTETILDIDNYDPVMSSYDDPDGRMHRSINYNYGHMVNHQPHFIQYQFKDAYSGEFYDGRQTRPFVIYPATVDLDKDGLADGQGILAHVEPSFSRLPTTSEIIEAINSEPADAEAEESIIQPANFTDNDQDGMPDALENKWTAFTGGHSNNSNDANLTYDFLLTDVYSYSQLMDLRLGSTLYEVNQGAASFNIILEESTDLNNWEPYGEYSLELSDDGNANTKFFRFKMAD